MQSILLTVFIPVLLFFTTSVRAQCTIDFSQTQTGIYPDTLPDGFVGQPYSTDITFVMPTDTMGYDFTNFKILSVSLPVGLTWQCNAFANGCNYDPQVIQHGCVNISGTPLLAGTYAIDVTVIADLTIVSGYPFSFQIYMEVLPSTVSSSNNGFSMVGASGCSPITVDFTNNNPGLVQYYWDFGNGNISTNENPVPQVYNAPGDYYVHYEAYSDNTTYDFYTLTNVTIQSIQNSAGVWGYPETPDLYIIIKENGAVIYQSTYFADTNPPVSWPLSISLNPLNTYVLEVWEEDDYEIFFGGDDYVGNHTMSLNGCTGCAANISVVDYTVNHVVVPPSPSVISDDTVHVYGYPGTPNIYYDSLNHVLHTDTTVYALQWYFNGSPIAGANTPNDTVLMSGEYWVIAINSSGCVSFSDTITAIYCQPAFIPDVVQNGNEIYTPDSSGNTFQWFDISGIIAGETNYNYFPSVAGDYTVEVTDQWGCSYLSNAFSMPVGVGELISHYQVQLFPNPSNKEINLSWNSELNVNAIEVTDITGKIIRNQNVSSSRLTVNIEELVNGLYFVRLNTNKGTIVLQWVCSE